MQCDLVERQCRQIELNAAGGLLGRQNLAAEYPADSTAGAELFVAANAVIDLAAKPRLVGKGRERKRS